MHRLNKTRFFAFDKALLSSFYHQKEPYLIMGRMLLKLRHDVAVTASGRSYCYVVTKLLLRRDVISPASLAE